MSEKEPIRWLEDDSALSGDERRALAAGLSPAVPANAKAAVWSALGAKLPLAASAAGATGAAAAAKATTTLSFVKMGLVGVALGSVSAAALVGGERVFSPGPASTARSAAPSTLASAPPPELPAATSTRRGDEATPLPAQPTAAPPARDSTKPSAQRTDEAPGSATAVDTASPDRSVASFPVPALSSPTEPRTGPALESRQVAEARARLRAGDARQALALLDRVRRDYPQGLLAQERDALSIEALLALGEKSKARALASDFLARYPKSPHAAPARRALR